VHADYATVCVLNKNVLTQVEMMVALRTIAPQDLKAMDAWIEVHGEKSERDTLMDSLPALPVGDAWFWSPGWPTTDGIFQRVHVLPIETFDSGASPKAGEKRIEPRNLADVDLGSLHEADGGDDREGEGERSEAAEGRDPAAEEGAREEAQHERQRSFDSEARHRHGCRRSCREERTRGRAEALAASTMVRQRARSTSICWTSAARRRSSPTGTAGDADPPLSDAIHSEPSPVATVAPAAAPVPRVAAPAPSAPVQVGDVTLSGTQQRMLDALAQYHQLGQEIVSRPALAGFCGVSHTTGTFKNNLSILRHGRSHSGRSRTVA
jgi:hypothetical protein